MLRKPCLKFVGGGRNVLGNMYLLSIIIYVNVMMNSASRLHRATSRGQKTIVRHKVWGFCDQIMKLLTLPFFRVRIATLKFIYLHNYLR